MAMVVVGTIFIEKKCTGVRMFTGGEMTPPVLLFLLKREVFKDALSDVGTPVYTERLTND